MSSELIKKLEALEAPEAWAFNEVLIEAEPIWSLVQHYKFASMLNCQAWESAAIMLKPEGSLYELSEENDSAVLNYENSARRIYVEMEGRNPAIALLICILKAREVS